MRTVGHVAFSYRNVSFVVQFSGATQQAIKIYLALQVRQMLRMGVEDLKVTEGEDSLEFDIKINESTAPMLREFFIRDLDFAKQNPNVTIHSFGWLTPMLLEFDAEICLSTADVEASLAKAYMLD